MNGSSIWTELGVIRFKIDENMPFGVALMLREVGYDAVTVLDQGLSGANDPRLLPSALKRSEPSSRSMSASATSRHTHRRPIPASSFSDCGTSIETSSSR